MERKQINRLILEKMAGVITPEDDVLLGKWLSESDEHRRQYESFMQRTDFSEWMQKAQKVNADEAWEQFETMHSLQESSREGSCWIRSLHSLQWLRYAAVFVIAVAMTAIFLLRDHHQVKTPVVSTEVQQVMDLATKAGKVGALVENIGSMERDEQVVKGEELVTDPANRHDETAVLSSLTKEELLAARRITTYHDKEFWVTLDDGTLVHLNYNTRLIHPQHFSSDTRDVFLDGEAYFMVAKDKRHPFVVHTENGDVKVSGTEFNVNTRGETKNSTSVVLVRGSVSVTNPQGREQMMKPGQQATLILGESEVQMESVDVDPYVAWNSGTFAFRYQPLEKVMEVLSKWYNVKVEYASADIRSISIVGDFDRYEQLDNMLNAIGKSTGLSLTRRGSSVKVEK